MKRARRTALRATAFVVLASVALGCNELDALRWQARIGDGDAQLALAELYARGERVQADAAQARHWYQRAAESGNATSQLALARILAAGSQAEVARSRRWLERAANAHHPRAQTKLGIAYYRGEPIRKNLVMAHMWLRLSSDHEARRLLAEIEPQLSAPQRRESDRRRKQWLVEHPKPTEASG